MRTDNKTSGLLRKVKKAVIVTTAAATIAYGAFTSTGCFGITPTPSPKDFDLVSPEYIGPNTYVEYIGGNRPEYDVSFNDAVDGAIPPISSYHDFGDESGLSESVFGTDYHEATDLSGNTKKVSVDVERRMEDGLADIANTEVLMTKPDGSKMTAIEAYMSLKEPLGLGGLYRGPNQDIVEGKYINSGSWVDNHGSIYFYSGGEIEISNQGGFKLFLKDGSHSNNAVITGSGVNNATISHFHDQDHNGESDSVIFRDFYINSDGSIDAKRLELHTEDNVHGDRWIFFVENYIPVTF